MSRWFCKQRHVTSSSSSPSSSSRLIYPSTLIHLNKSNQYSIKSTLTNNNNNNKIKTTKYTLITFIPLNLWEQFHRFANIYFIFILILNFLPDINAFAKEIAPIPVFITLAIVAIKDAYEDFRRYLIDCKVNKKLCEVYSIHENQYVISQWQHLRPGDFIRLHMNDTIPADILVLTTSNSTGICHIETSNLDGETNLKQREIVSLSIDGEISPLTFLYPIEVEAPNAELYKFNGKIMLPEKPIPIHKNNMLLRGCVLRNTDYVIGIVIYAGNETKAALNNSGVRFKRSKLERQINMDIIWCVLILVGVCFSGAIGSAVWHQNLPGDDVLFVTLDRNSSTSSPAYQGFLNFWRFVIIFQTIIPLPLYVTIEFVKMHQVWHMNNDLQLYDSKLDRRIEIRAFNIPEDLGQIEYVFTDKTGTLTENKMKFQRASINGNDYYTNNNGDDNENDDRFSETSSPGHTVRQLNTLRNLLENRTVFSCHQKTIHNELHSTDVNSKKISSSEKVNNKSIQQSNAIPSTSHTKIINDYSPYLTNHRTSLSSSSSSSRTTSTSQHLRNEADFQRCDGKQQNNKELSYTTMNMNNNQCISTGHKSRKNSNRYLLTDETRIQDYFLALAICNTAVVSVTKNTPTLFQEPPRRKGFRDYFRSGKLKSVTHVHQKLFKTKQQQPQQPQQQQSQSKPQKHKRLDQSMLTRNKQTTSTSSLLSNVLQSNRSNEMNTQIEQNSNNLNRLCNDYIDNNEDYNTTLNENISQETLIVDDNNSKLNDLDIQSINTDDDDDDDDNDDDNHHDNESIQTINCNNKKLLKINVLSANSARTFNEQLHHHHHSVEFLSSRCLPPVIEALNLDISINNSQHILNVSHIDEQITTDYMRSSRQQQQQQQSHQQPHQHHHSNIHFSQRSLSTEDINLQNSSRYMQQSDFESLDSIDYHYESNQGITIMNNNDNNDLQLNLNELKKPIDNDIDVNTTRTLTVRIHNGSTFELPIESDRYVSISSELKQCPLSDKTLFNSYESESPDELCLVKEACKQGYKLLQRGVDFTLLWLPKDGLVCIHVLRILPFDSQRKRMSILFRHPYTNEPILFTKGADTSIMNRLDKSELNSCELVTTTQEHIDHYSRMSLRTLVIAERLLTEDELHEWLKEVYEMETGNDYSEEAMMILMDKLERNFILLGATGIEDRLQEGVPETIEVLREAGMHVWMLTGDKQETAVNIARSANLITSQHRIMYLNAHSESHMEYVLNSYLYGILNDEFIISSNNNNNQYNHVTNPCYYDKQQSIKTKKTTLNNQFKSTIINTSNHLRSLSYSPNHKRILQQTNLHKPKSLPNNITYFHYENKQLKQNLFQNSINYLNKIKFIKQFIEYFSCKIKQHSIFNYSIHRKMLFVLVINGDNLNYVINNTKNRIKFIQLCEMCTNVICCRTTPGQKAAVVTLVKNELNVHTLAIGDGANDVNMIQVANVGIGINSGEEGMQAVMASDFAISQFRYLKQLLLVHGHCCYDKLAHTSLYLFYKDAIYIFLLFWFQMFNGFSGSNAIDQFSQILFSVTITGLPPFIMGIWDNPLDDKTLLANPILYRAGINGNAYRPWLFWLNIFDGLWQSLIVFFLSYFAYADDTIGLWEFGLFQTNAITLCTLLHSLLISRTLVVFHAVSFLLSYVLAYLMFTMIYHAVAVTAVPPECPYRIIFHTMNNAKFWLLTLITIILALLPRFLMITIKNTFYPNLDTIANLLTKYYGTGQHLPLESYLLRMPYSFLIRNNITILPTMNQLTSYTSDVNLNKSFNESTIDKSLVHNHQLHNHASIHSNNQSNLITITDTSFHLISHLAQILNLSNQIIHGVQPSINTSNQYTDNISHDTMATNDYYQQINITPRMITDYTNQYQQHHYHTFSGNVLCNRKLLTQRRYSTTHVDYDYDDDDDDENNKNEQHCRNNVLWSTMNTNNRILDSSISTEISTNDYHNKSLKHRQQPTQQQQQQQQYSTYPSARTSSKHRSSLHHDRHSPFKLDPPSYRSNEDVNKL